MRSPIQEAGSLCEYHWLFSDELPEESLPVFYPRVLNFGQSSTHSSQGSPYQPRPRFRREQSHEQDSPVFVPRNCPPCYFNEDETAAKHSADSIASPCLLQPSEAPGVPLESCHGDVSACLKRQAETSQEYDSHTRKYMRLSETRPNNITESNNSDASADFTPSTASPSFQFSGPLSGPSYSSFDHLLEMQRLRAQLAISEARNAQALVELADSRNCIDFLLNEVRRVIASGGPDRQIPEKVQRIMRNTETRVPLFTRASPVITHPTVPSSSHHLVSPVLPDPAWNEHLDPRNPYSYYFSEHSMVGASTQLELAPVALPTSSQLAPLPSFQSFESIVRSGEESSTSYAEMSRLASEDYIPSQPTSSLRQPPQNSQPTGGRLVTDWSHARLDSYLSLYYSEPLPSNDTLQEDRGNMSSQHYQLRSIGN
ncbi:hypothetical protein PTTG_12624 [Puccinia triticina 1-1 BBBD Race 1]|uniref:Uncharacterized protein n=2 Tax=Puccinia triticina TaxID=208348 RepID=A0A180H2Z5_PUCT1|nr:uncharacterized protein PtA15_2A901 [Puccinia triticina]OAV98723.1 hypothetical protein PTTG_12624 [Puccinia triticina 1-1 BBBD Race 1]WAQ82584.1 hypothetical protein PtA15_2A901 [Puccinia triticina]WAR53444.1 hypothetical protein PtB15_2B875 [Puccinia triticina]